MLLSKQEAPSVLAPELLFPSRLATALILPLLQNIAVGKIGVLSVTSKFQVLQLFATGEISALRTILK